LIEESESQKKYHLTANQLTDVMVDKFTTVIDLQRYLLEMHSLNAQEQMHVEQKKFVITLVISILSLTVAIFTMLYTRKKLFEPLIQAQHIILELSSAYDRESQKVTPLQDIEKHTLASAIVQLKEMLRQRDLFEFQLQNMANTDSLTGVSNRLALDAFLKVAELKQQFQKLSLIVVDIDNFKLVNDQYGHIFGDLVIVEIAHCLQMNIAESDLIVRFGGDEFLILIANTDRNWMLQIAESISADVSRMHLEVPNSTEKFRVSVSIGVACGAESWEALFNKADASLFKAKSQGRNKVVIGV